MAISEEPRYNNGRSSPHFAGSAPGNAIPPYKIAGKNYSQPGDHHRASDQYTAYSEAEIRRLVENRRRDYRKRIDNPHPDRPSGSSKRDRSGGNAMMAWEWILTLIIIVLLLFTLIRASIIAAGGGEKAEVATEISFRSAPVDVDSIPIWNGVNGR